jgi:threonine/homoserine/homoserine lactone efflux protein
MRLLAVCAVALVFGFVGSMPLAGPISVMVVARAAQKQFGEALRVGLGAAVAEAIYAGIAFFGYTTVLKHHPVLVPVSHGITAVVLIALGVWFAFWKPKEEDDEDKDKEKNRAGTVLVGFTVSALNPTLLVTWTGAVAFLFSKGLGEVSEWAAIPFGVCAGVGVGGWFAVLVAMLRKYGSKKKSRSVLTWAVRALGVALVGLGVWSGVQLVRWIGGDRRTPASAAASVCWAACNRRPLLRPRPGWPTPWTRPSPSRRRSTSCSTIASPARRAGSWPTCWT